MSESTSGSYWQQQARSVYYIISLPTEEAHHSVHPTRGANMMAQRVNPNIATKIVSEGMTDPYEVSKALRLNSVVCISRQGLLPNNPWLMESHL